VLEDAKEPRRKDRATERAARNVLRQDSSRDRWFPCEQQSTLSPLETLVRAFEIARSLSRGQGIERTHRSAARRAYPERERESKRAALLLRDRSLSGRLVRFSTRIADQEKPVRFAKLSPTGRERLPPLRADRAPENAATNDSATHSRESCCTTVKAAAWRKGAETVSLRAASQLVDPHFCRDAAGSRSVDSQRRRSQSHAGLRPRCIHLQLLDCIARGARESK